MEVNCFINIGLIFTLTASYIPSSLQKKKRGKQKPNQNKNLCFLVIIIVIVIIVIIPCFLLITTAGGTSDKSQDDGIWDDHGELSASGRQSELLPDGHLKPSSNSSGH